VPTGAFWTALALSGSLVASGAQVVAGSAHESNMGVRLMLLGAALGGLVLAYRVLESRAIRHFTNWLRAYADVGTTTLQNADWVRTAADADKLERELHLWENLIEDRVNYYCSNGEACRIEYLDVWTRRGLEGVNEKHAHVREQTAEIVSRIRALMLRLERRETTLRHYVPKLPVVDPNHPAVISDSLTSSDPPSSASASA
jgi:hypothetical protein